jgi:ferrous iron transport protein B
MELPPYHLPTFSGVMIHTWHRLKSFLIKAGKIILLLVAVLGFLNSMGTDGSFGNSDSRDSILSAVSRNVTPVFRPMGIQDENWPATVGLFTGIFAKEAVVGTLDAIYNQLDAREAAAQAGAEGFDFWAGIIDAFAAIPAGFEGFLDGLMDPLGLSGALQEVEEAERTSYSTMVKHFGEHGKKAAFAYLLFILIYAPCVAAMAAIYREIGLRWMVLAVTYLTVLAWVVATGYYQLATFAVNPAASAAWLGVCAAILVLFYAALRLAGRNKAAQ